MLKNISILLISAFLILTQVSFAKQKVLSAVNDPLVQIEKDYQNHVISLDEKALLVIKAIKNPSALPSTYKSLSLSGGRINSRSATMALVDLRVNWDLLSDKTKQAVSQALSRHETDSVYYSSNGFFKLHYDLTGTDAVPADDSDGNGIPDFIEKCAAYCDTAYQKHVELGYLLPPSDGTLGGDDKFDVYFEDMQYYGYAVPEGLGPMPWNDAYSYLVLNNTFTGFPPNDDPEGDVAGAAKVTIAHEYHHCVQFAYDYTEYEWYMELDAVYMEDIVFDQVNDNYNYLSYFMGAPQTSLMDNSLHEYASFIWNMFLAKQFDTSLMVSVWEGARYSDVFTTLSDTLQTDYGWTQDSAFAEFALWNYCTSTRDDGLHYEEGSNYPLISVGRTHSTYPVSLQNSPASIGGYAANYITFYSGSSFGKLHITFNGSDTRQWAAYIIKSTSINSYSFEKIVLDTISYLGEINVPNFETYYSVTLVGINLSEFSSSALFTYSADVILPYGVSSKVLTLDTMIYSGGEKDYQYQVFNTSPIDDIYNIIVWDDLGWITPDTIDRSILAGDSSIFTIPVNPPQGTPLETISHLYFKAQSWGDSTVVDSQSVNGRTVLQRGDVDFSGIINANDILYFINYAFINGPTPIPLVDAADFDCSGNVNGTDIKALIDYSFNSGPPPPCNPY